MAEFPGDPLNRSRAAPVSVAAAALAVAVAALVASGRHAPSRDNAAVILANLPSRGAFEVRNTGSTPVSLAREVILERQSGKSSTREAVSVALVDTCAAAPTDGCVMLSAAVILRPVPWNGFSCAPQCPGSCRANVYLGPGTFRFVAQTCDRTQRFVGPWFELTSRPD